MATSGEITADASAAQAKKNAAHFKKLLQGMHMGHGISSLREADYKGHHITIKTSYDIKIDGKPFKGVCQQRYHNAFGLCLFFDQPAEPFAAHTVHCLGLEPDLGGLELALVSCGLEIAF